MYMVKSDDTDESDGVEGEHVYIGSRRLADLKIRFGKWLEEERGW